VFDVVTVIELGDFDSGYTTIDFSADNERLYSLTCPLMLGVILVAIPRYTKGKLALQAKTKAGEPLKSRVDALDTPGENAGFLLAPPASLDRDSVATGTTDGKTEITEWQGIMDHLRRLPIAGSEELPVIPVDERAAEVRAIKVG
jgi:5'-nucleotidase